MEGNTKPDLVMLWMPNLDLRLAIKIRLMDRGGWVKHGCGFSEFMINELILISFCKDLAPGLAESILNTWDPQRFQSPQEIASFSSLSSFSFPADSYRLLHPQDPNKTLAVAWHSLSSSPLGDSHLHLLPPLHLNPAETGEQPSKGGERVLGIIQLLL